MGIGGSYIWNTLLILLIIVLLFGTNKLQTLGTELGNAFKGFRSTMRDSDDAKNKSVAAPVADDSNNAAETTKI